MRFTRHYTLPDRPVADQVEWKTVAARIADGATGRVIFESPVEVPARWSDNAANILAQKYLRKAGVPSETAREKEGMPFWLQRSSPTPDATFGAETSARQVFHRLAGAWTYHGWREGYFAVKMLPEGYISTEKDIAAIEENARVFYDEVYWCLAAQIAAPNSPQWFNTGLWWAYGIEGPGTGNWYVDTYLIHSVENIGSDVERIVKTATPTNVRTTNAYERPQPHACFLTSVVDDLVNPGGIMDLWVREARIFKHGAGSGVNPSRIRAKGEPLSGGGVASGVISFLRVGDRSAGAIQSGGTTRRAAKMVCLNDDHPEIEEFIDWKAKEEVKAAAIAVGSRTIRDRLNEVARGENLDEELRWARDFGIPQPLIDRALAGEAEWPLYDLGWECEALDTVSGQNANNSVRVTDAFLAAVDADGDWPLTARTDGHVMKTVRARDLWDRICRAAWRSGDPGVIYHDTVNSWGTCSADGEIRTTNPCSEFHHLDGSACNLASLNLTKFLIPDTDEQDAYRTMGDHKLFKRLDLDAYEHAARLWTVVLDLSVSMASFPSEEFAWGAYNYRTLGLGYSNAGSLLMRLGLPYDSDEGRALIAALTALMTGVAYRTSAELAAELGSFPRWEANREPMTRVIERHAYAVGDVSCVGRAGEIVVRAEEVWTEVCECCDMGGFRNAQTTLIAPTGTISFVMDCQTTGIEPEFALVRHKSLAGGGSMTLVNDGVPEALARLGYGDGQIEMAARLIETHGDLNYGDLIAPEHMAVFDCSNPARPGGRAIRPEAHVLMLGAVQPFLSGAASKTANLPNDATVEDFSKIFRLAHRLGVKAVAPYRDGSKINQPLTVGVPSWKEVMPHCASKMAPATGRPELHNAVPPPRGEREPLPDERRGRISKARVGEHAAYLIAGEYPDGRLGELFLEIGREGSDVRAWANCWAKAVSIGLQYGVPVAEFVDSFAFTRFEPAGVVEGHPRVKVCSSLADLAARIIGVAYLGREDLAHSPISIGTEVSVKDVIEVDDGTSRSEGRTCPNCHNDSLVRTGTCVTCRTCGYNEGCG